MESFLHNDKIPKIFWKQKVLTISSDCFSFFLQHACKYLVYSKTKIGQMFLSFSTWTGHWITHSTIVLHLHIMYQIRPFRIWSCTMSVDTEHIKTLINSAHSVWPSMTLRTVNCNYTNCRVVYLYYIFLYFRLYFIQLVKCYPNRLCKASNCYSHTHTIQPVHLHCSYQVETFLSFHLSCLVSIRVCLEIYPQSPCMFVYNQSHCSLWSMTFC